MYNVLHQEKTPPEDSVTASVLWQQSEETTGPHHATQCHRAPTLAPPKCHYMPCQPKHTMSEHDEEMYFPFQLPATHHGSEKCKAHFSLLKFSNTFFLSQIWWC